jgi:hypothetical protein
MTDIVDRWIETLKLGAEMRERLAREAKWKREDDRITSEFASRSTDELKKMWDDYPILDEVDFDIDDVHRALILRGEKEYVIY